ncbi:MAG: YecA family protein [Acidimicrobiales bacterium]
MHVERLPLLFGDDVLDTLEEFDLDDETGRMELVERFAPLPPDVTGRGSGAQMALRTVVINQILDDDPPQTWSTMERLLGAGLDVDAALTQLTLAVGEQLASALDDNRPFDETQYLAALDSLPLPDYPTVTERVLDTVRNQPGIESTECVETVIASFGGATGDDADGAPVLIEQIVDEVLDHLLDGPLHLLPDDGLVVLADLVDGTTLTHRLTSLETELGVLTVSFDLAAFGRFDPVRLADGTELDPFSVEPGHLAWGGPDDWLARFDPGDLLAVTVTVPPATGGAGDPIEATVTLDRVPDTPPVTDRAVEIVRGGYDWIVAESALPVPADELLWWLRYRQPDLFTELQPPLGDLSAAAGLDHRGNRLGHNEEVWRTDLFFRRFQEAAAMAPDPSDRRVLSAALEALDNPDATVEDIRAALDATATPDLLDVLADALFPHHLSLEDQYELGWADAPGRLFELVERATAVARRPREIATAEYLSAVLYERCGAPETAEDHLKRAGEAQPRLGPVVERLGWYRFDRGDAAGAMQWWRTLSELPPAARTIEPFLSPGSDQARIGRNDPCWCGSDRKFKRCHQGVAALPALPDRVGWLCRKASLWIDHSTDDARRTVVELATAWATGETDLDAIEIADLGDEAQMQRIGEAFADPILFDAALHEGGLYGLFLHERGSLLPDDEQLLASSWTTVDRSVHEVVDVDPGVGMTLRNLATGDVLEVREQTASTQVAAGERYCARVVPDGATHQIIGGVFPVRTGTEATVLDLCDSGDPVALCAWAGALQKPPQVIRKPGLIDEMFDRDRLESLLENLDMDTEDGMAVLNAELSRQAQANWLDEQIPALDGLTPREATADPTRREQLERLLVEFDDRNRQAGPQADLPTGFIPMRYDVDAMRRELGLT